MRSPTPGLPGSRTLVPPPSQATSLPAEGNLPSGCPRPPNPSCPLSPVHLPFGLVLHPPSPGQAPAQPSLLRTQPQIRLASSAPSPSLFVVCTPVTPTLFIHSATLPPASSSKFSLGLPPPPRPGGASHRSDYPLHLRPSGPGPVLPRPRAFVVSAAVPSALFILLPRTPFSL